MARIVCASERITSGLFSCNWSQFKRHLFIYLQIFCCQITIAEVTAVVRYV